MHRSNHYTEGMVMSFHATDRSSTIILKAKAKTFAFTHSQQRLRLLRSIGCLNKHSKTMASTVRRADGKGTKLSYKGTTEVS